MKKVLYIFLLLCLFAASLFGQNSTIRCPHCDKEIDADSKFCPYCREPIEWANVIIDASPRDGTTFEIKGYSGEYRVPYRTKLLTGRYKIIYSCGGTRVPRTLKVRKSRKNTLFHNCAFATRDIKKKGFIRVQTYPKDTYLHIGTNKIKSGETISFYENDKIGITVAKQGYFSADTTVTIKGDTLTDIVIRINPDLSDSPEKCIPPEMPNYMDTTYSNPKKYWGLGLMVLGASAVVTPAFSKKPEYDGFKKDIPTWQKVSIGAGLGVFITGGFFMASKGSGENIKAKRRNEILRENYENKYLQYRRCISQKKNQPKYQKQYEIEVDYYSMK
jgi:hypothetical protein